jgi:hypothetical protein
MSISPRIVAIGLLTENELQLLGQGFDRAFPIDDDNIFEDLLRAIDEAERQVPIQDHAPTRQ